MVPPSSKKRLSGRAHFFLKSSNPYYNGITMASYDLDYSYQSPQGTEILKALDSINDRLKHLERRVDRLEHQ
jgi:hypothetical protein